MSFKVGDKVRILESPALIKGWYGVEGTVLSIEKPNEVTGFHNPWPICVGEYTHSPLVDDQIGHVYVSESEITLVEPVEDAAPVVEDAAPVVEDASEPSKPEAEADNPQQAVLDAWVLAAQDDRVNVAADYLNELIGVYNFMEEMNRESGNDYAAAIYKQVAQEAGNTKNLLEQYLKHRN